jgi:hypothetical protein
VWNHARDTIAEGNSFVNCARGISFGLSDVAGTDHSGGVIRNNFFFRATGHSGDVAIAVYDSPNTQVLNNTIFVSGTYSSPIEYRFPQTTGVVIANNMTDGIISARDGATATLATNLAGARAEWFVNAAAGDLHLAASATSAIDRGTTTAAVTNDWDGHLRPQGPAYDIGADEYGATSAGFEIAGRVVDGNTGAPMASVPVTLSGARSQVVSTAAGGDFSFADLAGSVDYTVTPSKANVAFSPASAFYSRMSASQTTTDFQGFGQAGNQSPVVSMSANGSTFTAPASIVVSAVASDPDGTIARVEFYRDATLIGTDVASPYTATWSNVPAGTYSLTAVATDDDGAATRSAAVSVTVTGGTTAPPPANKAPTITLTLAQGTGTFTAPASISLRATVGDSDGTVRQVRFYSGSTLIGSDTNGPGFTTTWRNVSAGRYSITAVATDDDGATTRSAVLLVTVRSR